MAKVYLTGTLSKRTSVLLYVAATTSFDTEGPTPETSTISATKTNDGLTASPTNPVPIAFLRHSQRLPVDATYT